MSEFDNGVVVEGATGVEVTLEQLDPSLKELGVEIAGNVGSSTSKSGSSSKSEKERMAQFKSAVEYACFGGLSIEELCIVLKENKLIPSTFIAKVDEIKASRLSSANTLKEKISAIQKEKLVAAEIEAAKYRPKQSAEEVLASHQFAIYCALYGVNIDANGDEHECEKFELREVAQFVNEHEAALGEKFIDRKTGKEVSHHFSVNKIKEAGARERDLRANKGHSARKSSVKK